MGRELAFQYSQLGATVVGLDINDKGNNETAKEVRSRGGKFHSYS